MVIPRPMTIQGNENIMINLDQTQFIPYSYSSVLFSLKWVLLSGKKESSWSLLHEDYPKTIKLEHLLIFEKLTKINVRWHNLNLQCCISCLILIDTFIRNP